MMVIQSVINQCDNDLGNLPQMKKKIKTRFKKTEMDIRVIRLLEGFVIPRLRLSRLIKQHY